MDPRGRASARLADSRDPGAPGPVHEGATWRLQMTEIQAGELFAGNP